MTKELYVVSRDVIIGITVGKHSGYMLVEKNEAGEIIRVQTVDLKGGIIDDIGFAYGDFRNGNFIYSDGSIIPNKVYVNDNWIDTDAQWIEENHYKSKLIGDLDNPEGIFNKIKENAQVIDALREAGFSIDYNPSNQNCNSWSGYIADKYLNGFDVFDYLNEGVSPSDTYQGSENKFPFLPIGFDAISAALLEEILYVITENGLTLEDVNLSFERNLLSVNLIIENETLYYEHKIKNFGFEIYNIIRSLQSTVTTAEAQISPLVLDLDGDGVVETDKEDSSVHFDHDNNGFMESTGWVGKDDGLLVRDINGNGQIDNGTELFGNNSVLANGEKAANGFEALKDLDSNNDGVFNNQDNAWNEVKVWKDSNQNGVVDENELLTLEQAGVSGINLGYNNSDTVDENNNNHKQTGTFIKTDGTTGSIHDVWFDADKADTINKNEVTISDDIKTLPEIEGFGNVHSLQAAMAMDTTGTLKTLIEQYANEFNPAVRKTLIKNIIFHWTGVQDIDPESRKPSFFYDNPIGDARFLEALERFLGERYVNQWWFGNEGDNPHEQASMILLQAFDQLSEYVYNKLEEQTHCKYLVEQIKFSWNNTTEQWDVDVSQAVTSLTALFSENTTNAITVLHTLESIIKQYDSLSAGINAAFQSAGAGCSSGLQLYLLNFGTMQNLITEGNDIIYGTEIDNVITGLGGDDKIYGVAGNDTLVGGAGNDYLVGGSGSDVYFFEGSWGSDSIDNYNTDEKGSNPDKILFGEGISPADVTIQRQGNDLILSLHNGADTVKVYSYFLDAGNTTNTVDSIEFADGTVWNYDYVRTAWNAAPVSAGGFVTINGTDNNDSISGTYDSDFLSGEKGDDTINGWSGNDVIYGGKGNDVLSGDAGNDTYIWNWGDGFDTITDTANDDTISFGPGITFADLTFSSDNYDLKIIVKNNPSQGMVIKDFMNGLNYKIEEMVFSDGTQVHLSEIPLTFMQNNSAETIQGTEFGDTIYAKNGADKIYANGGNDTIIGGAGNDYIQGGSGDDTYVYNIGDGLDTIYDYEINANMGNNDKIKFGEGITFEDVTLRRNGNDLIIILFNDITQGIEIKKFFEASYFMVENLEFADGSVHSLTEGLTLSQSDAADMITATDYDDIVYGNGGNDTINTGNGNDTLIGGRGNDTLDGGAGNDTYIWNLGDGFDSINDYQGQNTIQFGEGISFADLTFSRIGYDLHIYVNGDSTQGMNIANFFDVAAYQNQTLKFADDSSYNLAEMGLTLTMADGDDSLTATDYDDIVYGNGGNDTINTGNGNDTLIGGRGNDTLDGGAGNDTYIWNLGDGFDSINDYQGQNTIQFGEGISFADLTFSRTGYDLHIYVNGDRTQGMSIYGYFMSSSYQNQTLKFADDSSYNLAEMGLTLTMADGDDSITATDYDDIVYGNGGNDAINAGNGNDTLIGGTGNDDLNGGAGNDTYIWNLGDGFDKINDSQGQNIIRFGEGITLESLTLSQSGYDLHIYVNGDRTQGMSIYGYFMSSSYQNQMLTFADGSTYNLAGAELNLQPLLDQTLTGDDEDNELVGGVGNDTITSGDGYNDITGGLGNDILNGGNDNDTYHYNLGDGADIINDPRGRDKIVFGANIAAADVTFRMLGNDLKLIIKNDESQTITIKNFFASDANKIETLQFADNTSKNIAKAGFELHYTNADDIINGTGYNDVIYANNGNDTINAGDGNDTLVGGKGNDTLNGGYGDDTYLYNLGDGMDIISENQGFDKIIFGAGISFADLSFAQEGNNLRIYVSNDKQSGILLDKQFSSAAYQVEELEFADGSSVNLTDMGFTFNQTNSDETIDGTNYDDVIFGNGGNDTLNGNDGDDTLIGGIGNDILNGGYGRDTYVYNLGDGQDIINEVQGNDKIKFGAGIALADLTFTQDGNNLQIMIKSDDKQTITINNFYLDNAYKVEKVEFADGSTFNLSTQGLILQQTNANDTVWGTIYNDTIYGNGGHDTLNGGDGNDTLIGGVGNDTLYGGNGDDTYVYNLGDGLDIINETGGNDKIVFGEGISQNDLSFERLGDDLKIIVNGDEVKGIQISNQFTFYSDAGKVETIQFANGSTLDISAAGQLIQAMSSFSLSSSATTDNLSNPSASVSEMYDNFAYSNDLSQKAV